MNNISIIDADYIPYLICYNKKNKEGIVEHEKTLEEIYKQIDDYIELILIKTKADRYIGYLSPKKTFRNELNPEYKAQRKKSEINFLFEAKLYLKEKYQFKQIENLESDDSCLITEQLLKDRYNIIIISPDKDIRNTIGNRYNPNKDEFEFHTKEYCDEYFWTSMIVGDSADNIKGIPKKGEKFAEKLIKEIKFSDKLLYEQILSEYILYFGEYRGIEEFYKNYKMLYILREKDGFEVKEEDLVEFKIKDEF